jgi:hypothetical protein
MTKGMPCEPSRPGRIPCQMAGCPSSTISQKRFITTTRTFSRTLEGELSTPTPKRCNQAHRLGRGYSSMYAKHRKVGSVVRLLPAANAGLYLCGIWAISLNQGWIDTVFMHRGSHEHNHHARSTTRSLKTEGSRGPSGASTLPGQPYSKSLTA